MKRLPQPLQPRRITKRLPRSMRTFLRGLRLREAEPRNVRYVEARS